MATVILDLSGTLPQTFTTGNWPASTMDGGRWGFTWSPVHGSSHADWANGSLRFWAVFATNDANGGGVWIECDSSNNISICLVDTATGSVYHRRTVTYPDGAAIRFVVDQGIGETVVSGCTTGNGTSSYTPQSIFGAASLTAGDWATSPGTYDLTNSAISDVDDDAAAATYTLTADPGSYALTGTAVGLKAGRVIGASAGGYTLTGANVGLTVQASTTLLGVWSTSLIPALWWDRTLSPPAWFAAELADDPPTAGAYTLTADPGTYATTGTAAGLLASRNLTIDAGSYTVTGANVTLAKVVRLAADAGSYTTTGTAVGLVASRRLVMGAGAYTLTGSDVGLTLPGSLDIGDHGIDFQTYGSASRDAAVTLDTQASGSIVIVSAGGLYADVNSAFTDNKSNTIQKIGSTTAYTDWGSTYGVSLARAKPPMTGGTTHTFTVPVTLFSESTAFAIEVIGGGRVVGYSWINTSNTGAGATVTSDPVTAYEPVVWLSFWWGASPVFSPDTTPFQASASGSGFTDLDSYLINNSSGEVQAASAALVDTSPTVASPVTKTVTWSHYPNQGAQVILIAIAAPATLAASSGTYTLTGTDVGLRRTYVLTAGAGSYALTGTAVTLRLAKTIVADAGAYAVTGSPVGLKRTVRLQIEAATYATDGSAVGLSFTRTIAASPATYATTGSAAGLVVSRKLTASAGSYTGTGSSVGIRAARAIAIGAGSSVVTGSAAGLVVTRKITAGAGSYATTGTAVPLARTVRLVVDGGSCTLTGSAAALRAQRALTAAAGAYASTGTSVGLVFSRRLAAAAGAYALTGSDVTLTLQEQRTINADPGSYALTGSAVGLIVSHRLQVGAGAYTATGSAAGLLAQRALAIGPGSYATTGAAATLALHRALACASGSYSATGTAAALTVARRLVALSGAYTLTGTAVGLTVSGAATVLPRRLTVTRTTAAAATAITRTTQAAPTVTRTTAATPDIEAT